MATIAEAPPPPQAPFVLLPLLLLALVLLLLLALLLRRRRRRLPGPPRLPLLGSYPWLQLPYRRWLPTAVKRYGRVFGFQLAGHLWVSLNTREAIQEALVQHAEALAGRQQSLWSETVFKGSGLVLGDGEVWRKHRRLSLKLLKEFGLKRSCMEEIVLSELQHLLCEQQQQQEEQQEQQELSVSSELFSSVSANVIFRILFGTRATDEPEFAQHLRAVQTVVQADVYCGFGPAVLLPLLLRLCRRLVWRLRRVRQAKEAIERLLALVEAKLVEARSCHGDSFHPSGFAEAAVRAGAGDEDFSEGKLAVTLFDLLIAGTDTTSSSLKWAALRLATDAGWQRRLADEIDATVGSRPPTMADTRRLPRLAAFLHELHRLHPALPTAVNHRAVRQVSLACGAVIPEGAWVFPNIAAAHTDPSVFAQPNEFRPQRFLENGRFCGSDEVLPFSVGPRACIGEQLARLQLSLVLARLLQQFTLALAPGHTGERLFTGSSGLVCSPPPFRLLLLRRTCA